MRTAKLLAGEDLPRIVRTLHGGRALKRGAGELVDGGVIVASCSIPANLWVQDGRFMELVLFSSVKGLGLVGIMDKSHALVTC